VHYLIAITNRIHTHKIDSRVQRDVPYTNTLTHVPRGCCVADPSEPGCLTAAVGAVAASKDALNTCGEYVDVVHM